METKDKSQYSKPITCLFAGECAVERGKGPCQYGFKM